MYQERSKPIVPDSIDKDKVTKPEGKIVTNNVSNNSNNQYGSSLYSRDATVSFPTFIPTNIKGLYSSASSADMNQPVRDRNVYLGTLYSFLGDLKTNLNGSNNNNLKVLADKFEPFYRNAIEGRDDIDVDDIDDVTDNFFNEMSQKGYLQFKGKSVNDYKESTTFVPGQGLYRQVNPDKLIVNKQIENLKRQFKGYLYSSYKNKVTDYLTELSSNVRELGGVVPTEVGSRNLLNFMKDVEGQGFKLMNYDKKNMKMVEKPSSVLKDMLRIIDNPNVKDNMKPKITASYIGAIGNEMGDISKIEYLGNTYFIRLESDKTDSNIQKIYKNIVTADDYTTSESALNFKRYNSQKPYNYIANQIQDKFTSLPNDKFDVESDINGMKFKFIKGNGVKGEVFNAITQDGAVVFPKGLEPTSLAALVEGIFTAQGLHKDEYSEFKEDKNKKNK